MYVGKKINIYVLIKNKKSKYNIFTRKLLEYHVNKNINYVSKRFDKKNYKRLDNGHIKEFSSQIIYPNSFIANYFDDNNVNNTSTVVKIQYKNFKVILPGDLEGEGWYFLKKYMNDLKCDILKMPHHGGYFKEHNKSLSTGDVIECTSPKFAIISTGQNDNYNHPYKETIEYLSNRKINTICTEVTDLCAKDRLNKKESIVAQLGIKKYKGKQKNCPCAGDIIFEIDDDIKLVSNNYDILNKVRENFEDRLCIVIKK
jgi:competence protein ComEC